jgi:hypothetical protein
MARRRQVSGDAECEYCGSTTADGGVFVEAHIAGMAHVLCEWCAEDWRRPSAMCLDPRSHGLCDCRMGVCD